MKKKMLVALPALLAMFAVAIPHAEGSHVDTIALGSVSAPGAAQEGNVDVALREALSLELRQASGVRLTPTRRAAYVMTAAVTRLTAEPGATPNPRTRYECEVSLIVSRRQGGAVRFILEGRAEARGAPTERLRDSVVRAAVRGALRSLSAGLGR